MPSPSQIPSLLLVTHRGVVCAETVVALPFISVTGGVSVGGPMDMLLQRLHPYGGARGRWRIS